MAKYTKEHLIAEIKKFFEINNRVPTLREFSKYKRLVYKFFGSWNNAVERAGFVANKETSFSNIKYTNKQLLSLIQKGFEEGKINARDYTQIQTIIDRFGSWNNALELAEVQVQRRRNYTKEEMKEKLLNQYNKTGKVPTCSNTKYVSTLLKIFGTFNEALDYAGLTTKKTPKKIKHSNEELKNLYIQLSYDLDKKEEGASINDVNKAYKKGSFPCSSNSLWTRFKGFNSLKESCGFDKWNIEERYTKEDLVLLLKNKIKEIGRKPSLRELKKMNNFPSLNTFYNKFETFHLQEIYEEIEQLK